MPKIIYECEFCRQRFDNLAEATACESKKPLNRFKVGDILTKNDFYGWQTGPDHWVSQRYPKDRSADGRGLRNFYWLVVEVATTERKTIYMGRHDNLLTLVTRGVVNGTTTDPASEWGVWWDQMDAPGYATTMYPVTEVPPEVRSDADNFLASYEVVRNRNGERRMVKK